MYKYKYINIVNLLSGTSKMKNVTTPFALLTHFWSRRCQNSRSFVRKYNLKTPLYKAWNTPEAEASRGVAQKPLFS